MKISIYFFQFEILYKLVAAPILSKMKTRTISTFAHTYPNYLPPTLAHLEGQMSNNYGMHTDLRPNG